MIYLRNSSYLCMACCLIFDQAYAEPAKTSSAESTTPSSARQADQAALSEVASSGVEAAEGCMLAHEQGQLLRLEGKLLQSRSAFKECSREPCPGAVQGDCVRWLDEVEAQIPTVVFEAITEAGAAQRVTVKHAERVVTEMLDGRPLELDPGHYEFRFELGERVPEVVAVLLKQGDKNRLVSVDFREPSPLEGMHTSTPPGVMAPAASVSAAHATGARVRPVPAAVYVFGAAAIASTAAATFFGVSTRTKKRNAYAECAPRCTEKRIESIQRSALLTDVALGTAALSTVLALVMYTHRPERAEGVQQTSPRIKLASGWCAAGGWAGLEGFF